VKHLIRTKIILFAEEKSKKKTIPEIKQNKLHGLFRIVVLEMVG